MTIAVIVAVRGPGEAELTRAIEAHDNLVVARRCADLAEAVAAASAGLGGVVVVSEQPRLDRSVVKTLLRHKVGTVGVPVSDEESNRMLALGIGTVAPVGAAVGEVVQAILESVAVPIEASDPPSMDGDPREGAVVAVWGPTGAPGRTTVAVNLASELASSGSVILIDADTYGGAVSQALGMVDEAPGVAAVARVALQGGEIGEAIRRYALEVRPGLRVLSGIAQPSRWPEVPPAAVEPTLRALRAEAAVTVVDCGFGIEGCEFEEDHPVRSGSGRDDATLAVLAGSDLIVVVGSAEPLGIQRLVRALGDLSEGFPDHTKMVVVNRVRSSVCGVRPTQAVADILARYASVAEVWVIPDDPKGCDAATLVGQTLSERAPRSTARRAIEAIARQVWTDWGAKKSREVGAISA